MRKLRTTLITLAILISLGCGEEPSVKDGDIPPDLVLRNVRIIDGSGSPGVPDRDILIRNGRIVGITPAGAHEDLDDAEILDLSGRTVIPGLVDMHQHMIVEARDDSGELTPKWDRESTLEMLPVLLDFGVTTVRDPGAPTEAAVTLRDAIARGELEGPRIFTAGRILISRPFDPDPFVHVRDREEIAREIAWQHAAGVDFIKVYSTMPRELVRIAIEEAHARGIRVVGHLGATTWGDAAELGIDGIEHPASWSRDELPEEARSRHSGSLFGRVGWIRDLDLESDTTRQTVRKLTDNHVAVDPTLMAMHTKLFGNSPRYRDNPDNRFAPTTVASNWPRASFTSSWSDEQYAAGQEQWPKLLAWTKLLHDSGVLMTVGTDSPTPWIVPGAAVHDEMALLAEAKIEPVEIIRMATHNAAIALGIDQEIGLVREGFIADLVVLRDDPTGDIRNTRSIELVIHRGKVRRPSSR